MSTGVKSAQMGNEYFKKVTINLTQIIKISGKQQVMKKIYVSAYVYKKQKPA